MEEQSTPLAKLITVDLDKEMRKRFLEYSMSVIVRAPCRMCVTD